MEIDPRNDVAQSYSKSDGETSEALLRKHGYSEAEADIIIERPVRRGNIGIILSFALFNIVALAFIYFLLSNRAATASLLAGPAGHVFPMREFETLELYHKQLQPGPESEAEWDADGPKGNGFVMVDHPERIGLPSGLHDGSGGHKRYGLTWAHQYHCLRMLRKEYWDFVANNSMLIGKSLDDTDADAAYMWHLAHCFDYLKQTIICNMDMTLEYPTNGGDRAVNGYKIPHQCTKRSIYDLYIEQHAPPDIDFNTIED